jgi:drug/metabolite transporter (DMT)-like permease
VTNTSRLDWLLFGALAFMWGSSYLFIKIGVESGLAPFTLVALRLVVGLALLAGVVAVAREPLPRQAPTYWHLAVMGVLSVALPFSLITWAEQDVDSALAAVLTGAVPLFVIPFAAMLLPNEGLTPGRVAGLLVGFIGVMILVGFDPATLADANLGAELALIGAAVSYAAGAVYARRFVHGLRPMIPALFQVAFAAVITGVLALAFERPTMQLELRPEAVLAIGWLGILGSGAAYLVFFRLLGRWGATRTSLVAYLLPVIGIVLGMAVLHEAADARLVVGTFLIIGGIALVNSRLGQGAIGHGRRRLSAAAD